jgi:glutamate synthase (NADPH/NADH) small chain
VSDPLGQDTKQVIELSDGRIQVNNEHQTSLPDVWAAGDCVPGEDLTVSAVQGGKIAAHSIDRALRS